MSHTSRALLRRGGAIALVAVLITAVMRPLLLPVSPNVCVEFDSTGVSYEPVPVELHGEGTGPTLSFDPRLLSRFRLLRVRSGLLGESRAESGAQGGEGGRGDGGPVAPILFVHGHRGDYKQVGTLAVVLAAHMSSSAAAGSSSSSSTSSSPPTPVLYALDFGPKSSSAFHRGLVLAQAHFLAIAAAAIGRAHGLKAAGKGVYVVAHSMGSVAARASALSPSFSPGSLAAVIALNGPALAHPVPGGDEDFDTLYKDLRAAWEGGFVRTPSGLAGGRGAGGAQSKALEGLAFVSLSSGAADTLVRPDLTSLHGLPLPPDHGFAAFTGAVSGAWAESSHDDIMVCGQIVTAVGRAVLEAAAGDAGEKDGTDEAARTHNRACRLRRRLSDADFLDFVRGGSGAAPVVAVDGRGVRSASCGSDHEADGKAPSSAAPGGGEPGWPFSATHRPIRTPDAAGTASAAVLRGSTEGAASPVAVCAPLQRAGSSGPHRALTLLTSLSRADSAVLLRRRGAGVGGGGGGGFTGAEDLCESDGTALKCRLLNNRREVAAPDWASRAHLHSIWDAVEDDRSREGWIAGGGRDASWGLARLLFGVWRTALGAVGVPASATEEVGGIIPPLAAAAGAPASGPPSHLRGFPSLPIRVVDWRGGAWRFMAASATRSVHAHDPKSSLSGVGAFPAALRLLSIPLPPDALEAADGEGWEEVCVAARGPAGVPFFAVLGEETAGDRDSSSSSSSLGSPLPANAPSALVLRSKRASAVSRHPVPTVLSPYALYRVVVEHDSAGPSGGSGGNACPAFSPVIHYESGATSPPIPSIDASSTGRESFFIPPGVGPWLGEAGVRSRLVFPFSPHAGGTGAVLTVLADPSCALRIRLEEDWSEALSQWWQHHGMWPMSALASVALLAYSRHLVTRVGSGGTALLPPLGAARAAWKEVLASALLAATWQATIVTDPPHVPLSARSPGAVDALLAFALSCGLAFVSMTLLGWVWGACARPTTAEMDARSGDSSPAPAAPAPAMPSPRSAASSTSSTSSTASGFALSVESAGRTAVRRKPASLSGAEGTDGDVNDDAGLVPSLAAEEADPRGMAVARKGASRAPGPAAIAFAVALSLLVSVWMPWLVLSIGYLSLWGTVLLAGWRRCMRMLVGRLGIRALDAGDAAAAAADEETAKARTAVIFMFTPIIASRSLTLAYCYIVLSEAVARTLGGEEAGVRGEGTEGGGEALFLHPFHRDAPLTLPIAFFLLAWVSGLLRAGGAGQASFSIPFGRRPHGAPKSVPVTLTALVSFVAGFAAFPLSHSHVFRLIYLGVAVSVVALVEPVAANWVAGWGAGGGGGRSPRAGDASRKTSKP
jgi:hypothetical protein